MNHDPYDYRWLPSARDQLAARARNLVYAAIKRGQIPALLGLTCKDCGAEAECYDHRNYHEPLKVEPVCKACNNRRGPGLPLPEFGDGGRAKRPGGPNKNSTRVAAGEGYTPSTCRLMIDVDWTELALSVDDSSERFSVRYNMEKRERVRNAHRLGHASGLERTGRGGAYYAIIPGMARYEFFKMKDPLCPT